MKYKIKCGDNKVFVTLPYKNGNVVWSIIWNGVYNYRWQMCSRPNQYNPDRVRRAQQQMLDGRNLERALERSAAACHAWETLRLLKSAHSFRRRAA